MAYLSRFFLLGGIVFTLQALGQTKELKPGTPIPNTGFNNVLNYKSGSLNFNDFKSKFLILGFWNTACAHAIKIFPLMDSLQNKYSGKIQFVLVTNETLDSTLRFFQKKKDIKLPQIPMLTGAKDLFKMSPVHGVPYTVWVDDLGIVKYFFASYNLSKQNLDNFISGKYIFAKQLDKPVFRGDYFAAGRPDSLSPKVKYYCYLSRYSDAIDIGNSERGRINDSTIRMSLSQASIVDLYKRAYREYDRYKFDSPESVVLLVRDSAKYLRPKHLSETDTWLLNNGYCFDMVLPISKKDTAYKIMQQQLYNYFGLNARVYKKFTNGKYIDILEIKE